MSLEIEATDVIKIILQFCKENALSESFNVIQNECQVSLNTVDSVETFVADINAGRWDVILPQVAQLKLPRTKLEDLYEQVVLEMVELRETDTARAMLRQTQVFQRMKSEDLERFMKLETLCGRTYLDLRDCYGGGSKEKRRAALAHALSQEVSMVPASRLMALIGQALKWQQSQGLLPPGTSFDLFRGMAQGQRDEVESYPTAVECEVKFGAKTHPEVSRFSPDGQLLVSGSVDGFVEVWDSATGKLKKDLTFSQICSRSDAVCPVLCLNFSRDSELLVSGSQDGRIKVWKIRTGQCLRRFDRAHTQGITCVSLSKDGSQVLSGSFDGTVRVHGLKSGKMLKEMRGHTSFVNDAIFSADGSQVVSASSDGTVRVWDAKSCECVTAFRPPQSSTSSTGDTAVNSVHVFPQNVEQLLVCNRSSTVYLMTMQGQVHDKGAVGLAHHPHRNLLATYAEEGPLKIWHALVGTVSWSDLLPVVDAQPSRCKKGLAKIGDGFCKRIEQLSAAARRAVQALSAKVPTHKPAPVTLSCMVHASALPGGHLARAASTLLVSKSLPREDQPQHFRSPQKQQRLRVPAPDSPPARDTHHLLRISSFSSDPGHYQSGRTNDAYLDAYMRSNHSTTAKGHADDDDAAAGSTLHSWLVNTSDFPGTSTWEFFNRASLYGGELAFPAAAAAAHAQTADPVALPLAAAAAAAAATTAASTKATQLCDTRWDTLPPAAVDPATLAAVLACCPSNIPAYSSTPDDTPDSSSSSTNMDILAGYFTAPVTVNHWAALPPAAVDTKALASALALCPPLLAGPKLALQAPPAAQPWGMLPPASVDTGLLARAAAVCPAPPSPAPALLQALGASSVAAGRAVDTAQRWEVLLPPARVTRAQLQSAGLAVCPSGLSRATATLAAASLVVPAATAAFPAAAASVWGGLPDAGVDTRLLEAAATVCPSVGASCAVEAAVTAGAGFTCTTGCALMV
ncbi:MAG: hypothetical protein WDW38_010923 [Sanguina aurantia]